MTIRQDHQNNSIIGNQLISQRLLAGSMLISATGTNIILVALSVGFFQESASALGAAGVYVAQFLPIFILMPVAWKLADRYEPKRTLIGLELGAGVATLMVGLSVATGSFYLAYALLFVRGFFDMTTKVARNVALKSYLDDEHIDRANNIVMTCNYIGQALGAVIGFALISVLSMTSIAMANAATYVISSLVCLLLPVVSAIRSDTGGYTSLFIRGKKALLADTTILHSMIILVFSVIFLQAYNQVARVWLPLAWLELPPQYGAVSEAIGVLGIVAGVAFVNFCFTGDRNAAAPLSLIFVAACITMITPFISTVPAITFVFYFMFMFAFEVAFMVSMNRILKNADRGDVPCLMVIFYGTAFGGMALTTILMGLATDHFGLLPVAAALATIAAIATLAVRKLEP
ncbi:MFS transporter [Cognatiyoonia sp. IB215182]|uniref:MFS transporter n=1 Tax=Cognatiyoonia sp. IB215182 TaxID=3097353 RepID=UPI002A1613F4|nr:MFS transporter [Cognatiyoonia sp. IB215182]MDX8355490.1 MFS transporter [Cognatiyoonia sp. IB215182]